MTRNLMLAVAVAAVLAAVPARATLTETLDVRNGALAASASALGATAATYTIDYDSSCGLTPTDCQKFTVSVALGTGYYMGDGGILALNLSTAAGAGTLYSYSASCHDGSTTTTTTTNTACPITQVA